MNFRFTTNTLTKITLFIFLSFINQNFLSIPSNAITIKWKVIWLLENLPVIFHLMYNNYFNSFNRLHFLKSFYFNQTFNQFFFQNLTFVVFTKLLKSTNFFQTTQLHLSFKYWLVKLLLKLEHVVANPLPQLLLKNKSYLNQYHTPLTLTNISLLNKVYRKFFLNSLLFLVYFWPNVNQTKLFTSQFIIPTGNLSLFIYYNNYFFKIFKI